MSSLDSTLSSVVILSPTDEFQQEVAFAQAVARSFGLSVETSSDPRCSFCQPVVAVGVNTDEARNMARRDRELLAFVSSHSPPVSRQHVQFGQAQLVPEVLRGRRIEEQDLAGATCVDVIDGETVHAWAEFGPFWISGISETSRYQLVGGGLGELPPGEALCEVVRPDRLASLAPLLGFFIYLRGLAGWRAATLKASFMIDDPNLHTGKYGYLCFRDLVQEAVEHEYHVSLATVPIDAWYVHKATASLVQRNPSAISLLIHGNVHTRKELARNDDERRRLATLAQSLSRIESLERRSGLRIARVMAAPHGACSEEMLYDMRRLGFEAACISSGSLRLYNQSRDWSLGIGVQPTEFVRGLPVIPRFRLSKHCHNQVLLAALLGQPLILAGHHWDLADGLELLADLAEFINGLGDVRWMDMTSICRSNFNVAENGEQTIIETFSNRITLELEGDEKRLLILRRDNTQPFKIALGWEGSESNSYRVNGSNEIQVGKKGRCEVSLIEDAELDYQSVALPDLRTWPVVRRLLVEVRDRTRPLTDAVLGKRL